jgi:polyphosphate glucokinase
MPMPQTAPAPKEKGPFTLAIDIGGTGLKATVLDAQGHPTMESQRVLTPRPATPSSVLDALAKLVAGLGAFDRISAGFPGVVLAGVVRTAPNLGPSWAGFHLADRLAQLLKRPARVLNDAGVQGFGIVRGVGLEMVLTLGTGLGCGLFYEGMYIPNLELGHHPFRKGKTYEDYLGHAGLARAGAAKWNRRLAQAIEQIQPIWNPDRIYLGGGNAKHVTIDLPPHIQIASNAAGLLGGIALWDGREGIELSKAEKATKTTHAGSLTPTNR